MSPARNEDRSSVHLHPPTPRAKCSLLVTGLLVGVMLGGCSVVAADMPSAASAPEPTASASTARTTASAAQPATATPKPTVVAKPKPKVSSATSVTVPSDNTLLEWNFQRNKKHTVPQVPTVARKLIKRYNAMYVGPDPKLVYLTFDEGYENGNTRKILDTLKAEGVHATFFVTGDYCREAPKLCRRMLAEGHVVGSHSNTHPSMPNLTGDSARFGKQFTGADGAFKKATGQHLTHLFRPPMGDYSAKSLAMTQRLGYTSVFWSFAHVDYDEKAQPPVAATVSRVLSGGHPGAIFLLHGMSTSDTAALPAIIKGLRAQGYEFGVLEAR